MTERFQILEEIIRSRRSTKPVKMTGGKIADEEVEQLLRLANWAPSHGLTEPWRFIVYSGEKVKEFCHAHAELYKSHTPSERFEQAAYDKQFHNGDLASHLVIVTMQRGNSPKVPVLEEIAATAMAIQNILLGATAAGIASFISTSGMTHHESMKNFLGLRNEDLVMGLLYFGHYDGQLEGKRRTGIEEKSVWK